MIAVSTCAVADKPMTLLSALGVTITWLGAPSSVAG